MIKIKLCACTCVNATAEQCLYLPMVPWMDAVSVAVQVSGRGLSVLSGRGA